MTARRALATACALYGRATVALALAHVAGAPGPASLRGACHRAVIDGRRIPRAELAPLVAGIPAHVEACPACARLARESRDRGAWLALAGAGMLEPGEVLS